MSHPHAIADHRGRALAGMGSSQYGSGIGFRDFEPKNVDKSEVNKSRRKIQGELDRFMRNRGITDTTANEDGKEGTRGERLGGREEMWDGEVKLSSWTIKVLSKCKDNVGFGSWE